MPDFSLSRSSIAYFPTGRTSSTEAHSALAWVAYPPQRLREATTSSLVSSLPLWNLIPCRSLIVYTRPSAEAAGIPSARSGIGW